MSLNGSALADVKSLDVLGLLIDFKENAPI